MSRCTYRISDYTVGTESGGNGTIKLNMLMEVDPAAPNRVYITQLSLVFSNFTRLSASWLNQRPYGLYLLLTPESEQLSTERGLGYNNIPSSQYSTITTLPVVNPYSWTTSGTALPRVDAISNSTSARKWNSALSEYEPWYVKLAEYLPGQDPAPFSGSPAGGTLTTTITGNSMYFDTDNLYVVDIDDLSNLYIKYNSFHTHTTGADWYGWIASPVAQLKSLISSGVIIYHANGGAFADNAATYTDFVDEGATTTIRRAPETVATHTCYFSVPSGVTQPSSVTYRDMFMNWTTNSDGTGTVYLPTQSYSSASNLTLYANWLRPNFGALPEPTRSGYKFAGWSLTPNGTAITSTTQIPRSVTFMLYSLWTPVYSIIYDANGGTGTLVDPNSPYDVGTQVTVLDNTFVYPGKVFVGWTTNQDGSGSAYPPYTVFNITEDIVLYAQWRTKIVVMYRWEPHPDSGDYYWRPLTIEEAPIKIYNSTSGVWEGI